MNDHLKLFEYGLFLIVDKDNNNYLDVYEFQNFKKILHPIYGNEFNMDNNGNNKEISLKEMKKIKTDRCFGESTDNLNNLVLFRSGKNIKLKECNGDSTKKCIQKLISLINEDIRCINVDGINTNLNDMETYTILYSKFLEIINNYIKIEGGFVKTNGKRNTKRKKRYK